MQVFIYIIYYFNNKSNDNNDRFPVGGDIEQAIAIHHSPTGSVHIRKNDVDYIDSNKSMIYILYIRKEKL